MLELNKHEFDSKEQVKVLRKALTEELTEIGNIAAQYGEMCVLLAEGRDLMQLSLLVDKTTGPAVVCNYLGDATLMTPKTAALTALVFNSSARPANAVVISVNKYVSKRSAEIDMVLFMLSIREADTEEGQEEFYAAVMTEEQQKEQREFNEQVEAARQTFMSAISNKPTLQ